MKIAYILYNPSNIKALYEKVEGQSKAWENSGCDVEIIIYQKGEQDNDINFSKIKILTYSNFVNYFFINYKLLIYLLFNKKDIVYTRSQLYMPGLLLLFMLNNVVVEINSDEINEYKILKVKNRYHYVKYYYKTITRRFIYRLAKGFVAVTNEIGKTLLMFKKPISIFPNCINVAQFKSYYKKGSGSNIPTVVFVGFPDRSWHGIDKIMKLAEKSVDKLKFNIIGYSGFDNYKLPNVKFWGYCDHEKLLSISQKSDIAYSSFALHRIGINEACPFKSRYYLACGLPMIVAYKDDKLECLMSDYILEIDNDEDTVTNNLDRIIDFCYSKKDIFIPINIIMPLIDYSYVEGDKVKFFNSIINKSNY